LGGHSSGRFGVHGGRSDLAQRVVGLLFLGKGLIEELPASAEVPAQALSVP
jgi:hypothetical protein